MTSHLSIYPCRSVSPVDLSGSPYFDQFLDISCSYLKPECLKDDYFKSSESELVVMHNNVCSLSSNFHKIEELFLGSSYRPHIIALSETEAKRFPLT